MKIKLHKSSSFSTLLSLVFILFFAFQLQAQIPKPALVGYWQNWNSPNAGYIPLTQVDARYNVVNVSFATPKSGTTYDMQFVPTGGMPDSLFKAEIQTLKNQGRTVNLSVGGGGVLIELNDTIQRDIFVASMLQLINLYDFDGLDIDLESGSVAVTGGTISNPIDAKIIHMIDALKLIMADYHAQRGKKLILTMAPETAFVQGGQSNFNGIWGGYLPIIDAVRDSLDLLHVQLYNSGSMYGIDGNIYVQSTADFIVSQGEAVIQGFNTNGGFFAGLPAEKIAIGLPACPNAAGGGYTDTLSVRLAMQYLRGGGISPGSYTLALPGGYPDLGGMMTWSVNWDKLETCGAAYEFAGVFSRVYGMVVSTEAPEKLKDKDIKVYPNPATDRITVELEDMFTEIDQVSLIALNGQRIPVEMDYSNMIEVSFLQNGFYILEIQIGKQMIRKKVIIADR